MILEVVCIVRPNIDKPEEYLEGEIIVTRNPCLHPGDIRKVTAISMQEIMKRSPKSNPYSQYFNCVVFPCKGKSLPA
jgi:RNA-dependent RNA polymerase